MKGHLKLGIFIVRKKIVTISEIMYTTPTPPYSEKKKSKKKRKSLLIQTQEFQETKAKSLSETCSSTRWKKERHHEKAVENRYP